MTYEESIQDILDPRTKHLAGCLNKFPKYDDSKISRKPFMTELGLMQYSNGSYRFPYCEYKGLSK